MVGPIDQHLPGVRCVDEMDLSCLADSQIVGRSTPEWQRRLTEKEWDESLQKRKIKEHRFEQLPGPKLHTRLTVLSTTQ